MKKRSAITPYKKKIDKPYVALIGKLRKLSTAITLIMTKLNKLMALGLYKLVILFSSSGVSLFWSNGQQGCAWH